jgi:F1F0 ATPase subunit 2
MIMINILFALVAGALLGGFFFAGLWWTVRQLGSSQHVALLFLGSMLFRTGVVIVGFYFILGESWQQLLAGLVGFILIRLLTMQYVSQAAASHPIAHESDYAP